MSEERRIDPARILAARVGHGANCSSIGSVVDTLFAAAVVGTAVFAALAAALATEEVRVVGERTAGSTPGATDPGARRPQRAHEGEP
jgi:hypothetical protein